MPMATVNGAELYHEVRGDGPPVLLVTGATGDGGHFDALADMLADEFTVISYDRRGNGRSPRPAAWAGSSLGAITLEARRPSGLSVGPLRARATNPHASGTSSQYAEVASVTIETTNTVPATTRAAFSLTGLGKANRRFTIGVRQFSPALGAGVTSSSGSRRNGAHPAGATLAPGSSGSSAICVRLTSRVLRLR